MNKNFLLIMFLILSLTIIFFILFCNETIYLLIHKNKLNNFSKIIKKNILPRNYIPIKNKYEIIKDKYDFSDFHIVIYWNSEYNCKIIIRRLDDTSIINPIMICIYSIDNNEKNYINIKETNIDEIIFDYETSFILDKIPTNQIQTIPKLIIQTTKSNNITKACFNAIHTFIDLNPEYEYRLYDDNDCYEFIKNNFSDDVLIAYNDLIPGAYKADLFRYCVLYITGGCYFDIKQILRVPLRDIIDKTDNINLVKDINYESYYNAIIFIEKKNPLMLKLINQITINVKKHYYGSCPLCPTGPCLLFKLINHIKPKYYYHTTYTQMCIPQLRCKSYITYKKKNIMNVNYVGYYQLKNLINNYYFTLWIKGKIYKKQKKSQLL